MKSAYIYITWLQNIYEGIYGEYTKVEMKEKLTFPSSVEEKSICICKPVQYFTSSYETTYFFYFRNLIWILKHLFNISFQFLQAKNSCCVIFWLALHKL